MQNKNHLARYSQAKKVIRSVILGEAINSNKNKALILNLAKQTIYIHEYPLSKKAKIALVIPYHPLYEIGGLEIGTMQIAKNLMKLGQKVEIVSKAVYPRKDFSGIFYTSDGIRVNGIGKGIEDIISFLFSKVHEYDVIQWMEIFPPIPEKPYIYNDKAEQQYLASVLLRFLGKKVYLYVATSGNVTSRGTNNPLWNCSFPQSLNVLLKSGFTGFNFANPQIALEYKKIGLKISKRRMAFIPFGVDINKFYPVNKNNQLKLREKLNFPKDKIIFFYLGRFVTRKRPDVLLDIWNTLSSETLKKSHLIFIGGRTAIGQPDSIYGAVQKQILTSKEVTSFDNVSHKQMPKYIQACDIMIFPSEREGWPLALMEAMACGKIILSSNIDCVKNIIDSSDKGLLFETRDFNTMTENIINLSKNFLSYKHLGKNARNTVVYKYSWEIVSKKYLSFFRR